ncbi:MAG TPA: T9SS type A sorting domain-containing protein, partial [Cyclobacteriaceae bacterium]
STTGWRDTLFLRVFSGMDPTFFYNSFIQINKAQYYHNDFRFRFISFGRKSGRYDAWHVDYVYMNKGRIANDLSFPDRAYFTTLSPLFDQYYAMPHRHFKSNVAANTSFNSFGLANLKAGAPGNGQPMNYSFYEKTVSYLNGTPTTRNLVLANATPILPSIEPLEKRMLTLSQKPDYTALASADSIVTDLTVVLETGDSVNTGFEPIDFYVNDTLRQSYRLTDYYAYDDGTAEYAAGLTTAGNHMAYKFEMKTPGQDTIKAVSFYFPYFAGTSATSMAFSILSNDNGMPGDVLYEQTIDIEQTANNLIREISLFEGVIVQGTFFISYREPATGKVRIGLDKSHDTGDRMYYRLTDTSPWQVNDRVTGSFMMRPKFGHAIVPTTGLPEEEHPVVIYPNPSNGDFYLKGLVDNIHILTITGQPVAFTMEEQGDEKKVNMATVSRGVYILTYRSGQKVYTEKLIITN